MGRPNKYDKWLTPKGLQQLENWAAEGLTGRVIENKMSCSHSAFQRWQSEFKDIKDSLQRGREIYAEEQAKAAEAARASLLEWREVTDRKVERITDADGKLLQTKTTENTHVIPPNMAAVTLTLKKLKPQVYGDEATDPREGANAQEAHDAIVQAIKALSDSDTEDPSPTD